MMKRPSRLIEICLLTSINSTSRHEGSCPEMKDTHFFGRKILAELLPRHPRHNLVLTLLTVGEDGYPNVCLLSPFQVLARANHTIFFAVYSGSKTQTNLSERGKATFVIFLPPAAYYIRGKVEPIASFERIARLKGNTLYRFEVTNASRDYYRKAPIMSTVTFDKRHVRRDYERVYQGLLELASKLPSASTLASRAA